MKAVIVCNGTISDYKYMGRYFKDAELVICADGGAAHLRRFNLNPHILLGDFDSISKEDLDYFRKNEVEIVAFPVEKDATDTEIAVDLAIERGCNSILILGGVGTRLDHTLSNIFLLKKMMDKEVTGVIANEYNEIILIKDSITIPQEKDVRISLLPLSAASYGVTTKGLYYPLVEATVEMGSTWGVSNEISGDIAEVIIKEGLMLVIKSRE